MEAEFSAVRIGVFPTGVGKRLHRRILAKMDGVTVVPVHLPRLRADLVSAVDWRLPADEAPLDLCIVGSPPFCHVSHASTLIRHGISVLCEKPVGVSSEEATRLLELSKHLSVECAVNYQLRFHPLAQAALRQISAHDVRSVEIVCESPARTSRKGLPAWYWRTDLGGGVWFSLMSHLIDLCQFFGLKIADVKVKSASPSVGRHRGIDALTVTANCVQDILVTIVAGGLAEESQFSVRVTTAQGSAMYDFLSDGDIHFTDESPWQVGFRSCMESVLSNNGSLIEAGCAPVSDAVAVHRVIQAVRLSLARGGIVQVVN
ncbi:Gfo/Idh/MocA family protein [Actinosynnema sp. CA-299493]